MLNDYGKELFRPWLSVQNICLLTVTVFIFFLLMRHFDLSSAEVASWVQAIGSIAAIWGAFTLSNNQLRRHEEQRLIESKKKSMAFFAVVKHAVGHARAVKETIDASQGQKDLRLAWGFGYSEIFKSSNKSLGLIPAHELGDYELVIAHNHIFAAMTNMLQKIERYMKLDAFVEHEEKLLHVEIYGLVTMIEFHWSSFEKSHDIE